VDELVGRLRAKGAAVLRIGWSKNDSVPVGNTSGLPVASQLQQWIMAIIGRGADVRFGIPACHNRMSRMSMLPRRKVG